MKPSSPAPSFTNQAGASQTAVPQPLASKTASQVSTTQSQLFDSVESADRAHQLPPAPKSLAPIAATVTHTSIAIIDLSASHPTSPAATQLDIAMRRFSGMTLLEWCVRRLSESTLLDNTIVTGLPSYQPQVQSAGLCNARWMPSLESESIDRITQIADRTNATWIAIISPNCPFFDAALLDRLLASAWSHPDADYVTYMSLKHNNIDWNRFGLSCDVIHRRMLETSKANKLEVQRGLTGIAKSYPNLIQTRSVPLPDQLDQENLHFALETAQDWEHAQNYLEAVGEESSWQRLVETSLMRG
jgi:spore coat polysaccharide biosynthesis protein SpsF (cytidylyltransferase family)